MPSTDIDPILTKVTRSGRVESWHRGAVAVVHEGETWFSAGAILRPVFCRSAVKPFQALPLLERGLHDRLGFGDQELAVMIASHDGSDAHVRAVRSLLAKAGLSEELLGCGPHAPFDADTRTALLAAGQKPGKVHNNCSGKHAGFLALAREVGDDLGRYLDPESRSQQEVNAAVAAMAGVPGPVPVGVDGCGAPTFILPLCALAQAFCRFAGQHGLPPLRAAACRRLLTAVAREPELFSGARRLCSTLLRVLPRGVLPKNGAEGVYALALLPDPRRTRCPGAVGIAVKVDDGEARGYQPVVVDLLRELGAFGADGMPASLHEWHRVPVRNTRGETVGEACSALDFSTAGRR